MVLNLKSKPSKEKVPKPKKEAKPGKKLNPLKKEKPVKQKKIKAADPKKEVVGKPKDPKQGKVKTPNLFKKPKLLKKDEDVKVYNASPAPGQAPRTSEQEEKKSYKSILINGVLICIILALSLALLLVLLLSGKDKRNVCETPECISLSQQLLNWRDESVDPCNDFFQYSCGKYNEHVTVQGDSLDKQRYILNGLIREYLLKNKTTSSASENAMLQLFAKCQEYRNITNGVRAENFKKLAELVKNHVGTWNDVNFNITKALPNIVTKFGNVGNIIDFGLFVLGTITGAEIAMEESQYKLPNQDTMKKIISETLKFTPSNDDLRGILSFKAEWDGYFMKDIKGTAEYKRVKTLIPSIDFDQIIKSTFKSAETTWPKIESKIIGSKLIIKVFELHGAKLEGLIKGKRKDLGNFLIFKFLETLFNDLNLNNECHSMVTELLPLASYRVFIRNHFDKENMEDVAEMVENTKDVFIEMIEDSEWLDDKTKKNAIKKAKAMKTIVGYQKEFEKAGAFDEIFNFEIKPSDFYSEILFKARKYSVQQLTSFIASETTLNPMLLQFTTNAFYFRFDNSITVLAPIIDDPLFHHSFPEYAKIAGVGFIISHEIGHGFDNKGRNHDENGKQKMWWTEKDVKEYEKRMMCLVEQYEKYDDPSFGKNLNGSLTLGEMTADQISSDVSWRHFKKIDLEEEQRLVGFEDYDIEKLYFQIGALNWCSPRPSHSLQMQLTDNHAVNSFRVNGVFANTKQFADTYDCPAGSPMNPKKKCEFF
ncbi:hypothetical protein CRE_06356 [Caenorhabditis remanei]|uniref:Uncharacterized protein n=1 Tax=Caenorhabditis remanei TaxID=31234 RepID=E3M1P0_CAERE|nr:hypothetical protein CRE_06356 [Caenorhabditis remanei]